MGLVPEATSGLSISFSWARAGKQRAMSNKHETTTTQEIFDSESFIITLDGDLA
jgi:hypothetical protein